MWHAHDQSQARQFATAALDKMFEFGAIPNPSNFTVFYAYEAHDRPDLDKSIEELIAQGEGNNEKYLQKLYHDFFVAEDTTADVQQTSERIQSAVGRVMEHFRDAQSDASRFGQAMEGISEVLAGEPSAADIETLVHSIVRETSRMAGRSGALEREIAESSQEIEALRDHLAEVQKEALTDQLTGIANRKCFDARLQAAAEEADEDDSPLCLLLTDIDHFKKFNDTHGHQVGDKVLRTVGRSLRAHLKGRDTPARYGGEEFGVILPETNLANAVTVAEQIRGALAKCKLTDRKTGNDYGNVTLSIGVSQYRPGEELTELIERADQALYRAKGNGRNRVEVEEEEEPESGGNMAAEG